MQQRDLDLGVASPQMRGMLIQTNILTQLYKAHTTILLIWFREANNEKLSSIEFTHAKSCSALEMAILDSFPNEIIAQLSFVALSQNEKSLEHTVHKM